VLTNGVSRGETFGFIILNIRNGSNYEIYTIEKHLVVSDLIYLSIRKQSEFKSFPNEQQKK
jgi:hypothetical protein